MQNSFPFLHKRKSDNKDENTAKRKPSFFIENLIEIKKEEKLKPMEKLCENLEEKIEAKKYMNAKSQFLVMSRSFNINKSHLTTVFQKCVKEAMKREFGTYEYESQYVTCSIVIKDIKLGDAWIPICQMNERLDTLFKNFYELVQMRNYSTPDSFFCESFTIYIDVHYNTSHKKEEKKQAKKKRSNTKVLQHQIKKRKLIKVS
jgi:hypothetical protein